MDIVFGMLAIVLALFALATALVPRWRGIVHWKGTRVPAGIVSSLGFALAFGGIGLVLATRGQLDDLCVATFVVMVLAGLAMIFVGQWLDFRG
jgi:hypothetical protein